MIHVAVSIGVAIYPDHGRNPDELLGCSDIAMYNAKEMGKNQCSIYNKNMHTKGFPQKALERLDQRESLKKVSKKMQ